MTKTHTNTFAYFVRLGSSGPKPDKISTTMACSIFFLRPLRWLYEPQGLWDPVALHLNIRSLLSTTLWVRTTPKPAELVHVNHVSTTYFVLFVFYSELNCKLNLNKQIRTQLCLSCVPVLWIHFSEGDPVQLCDRAVCRSSGWADQHKYEELSSWLGA